MGKVELGDADTYATFREHTETIVQSLLDKEENMDDGDNGPDRETLKLKELDLWTINHSGGYLGEDVYRVSPH